MPKRIALFILGFVLAIGAFLLYQYFYGAGFTASVKKPIAAGVGTVPAIEPSFESRDSQGRLEYLITCKSADQLKDPNTGNLLPGQFKLDHPVATFYEKNGRILEIKGDKCVIVLDQDVKGKSGGGLGGGGGFLPQVTGRGGGGGAGGGKGGASSAKTSPIRLGTLSGHVRLRITARPVSVPTTATAAATATSPAGEFQRFAQGEIRVYVDDELRFDRDQQLLSTDGKIYIRSDVVAFDGQGMTISFTEETGRIEYLRVDPWPAGAVDERGAPRSNKILFRGVGEKALAMAGASTEPATRPTRSPATAQAGPVLPSPATGPDAQLAATRSKPVAQPVVYKLAMGQDVHAHVGKSTMSSDRLILLFMAGSEKAINADEKASDMPPSLPAPATTRAVDTGPAPMPEEREQDLVLTWSGPMEMRPAADNEVKLTSSGDIALEALGAADRPVDVRDPRFLAKSGRLWYHGDEHRIRFEPGDYGRVELQTLDAPGVQAAARGQISCQQLTYFQLENKAELIGPGLLETHPPVRAPTTANAVMTADAAGPATVAWTERMDIWLTDVPDPKDPAKRVRAVSRAMIYGAGIHTDAIDMTSDQLDVQIANTADTRQSAALKHLLASGHVVVDMLGGNGGGAGAATRNAVPRPAGLRDGLRADRMEIRTAPGATAKAAPVPSQLLAEGNVSAWQFVNKNRTAGGVDPANFEKEMVSAQRLAADLKPKETKTAAPAASLATIGQNADVSHFLASGDVRIDILPAQSSKTRPPVVALADTLDADIAKGLAHLSVADAAPLPVRISMGEDNAIEGRVINLTQLRESPQVTEQSIEVPGPGKFSFIDRTRKKATPLEVSWTRSMAYDNRTKLAIFTGHPIARVVGEKADLGQLAAENLLKVQLREAPPATRPATAPAAVALAPATAPDATNPAAVADALGLGRLELDYIEAGSAPLPGQPVDSVDARGSQLAADNTVASRLRLSTAHLIYRKSSQTFEVPGPGSMIIDNLRPEKAAATGMSTAGAYNFAWQGNLVYDSNVGTVTFNKDVNLIVVPTKPFHLTSGDLSGSGKSTAHDVAQARLSAQQFVATLAKSKDATTPAESPIGIGTGGKQEISTILATGDAQLIAGDFELRGHLLQMDVPKHTTVVQGLGETPAFFQQPGQRVFLADKITWDMLKDHNTFSIEGPRGTLQN